mgnify:CR=1 FL=1
MSLGLDLRGGVYFLYEVDVQGRRASSCCRAWNATTARCCVTSGSRSRRCRRTPRRSPDPHHAARCGRRRPRRSGALRKQDVNLGVDDRRGVGEGRRQSRSSWAPQHQGAPGLRDPAEHHDAAQPRRRARRDRADRRAPGCLTASSFSCRACADPNEALRVLGATATLEFRLVDDQNDPDRGGAHQAGDRSARSCTSAARAVRCC